jgi:glutamate racemase
MIGLLDSGVGGLSVLRAVREVLPDVPIRYVGDQGHLPYGQRPREEVRAFARGIAHFLIEQGCTMLVIPCHTANAAALHTLREQLPQIPIVGMEPAVKPAAEHTQTGIIGVIMTAATYHSELYASVVDRFAQHVRVEARACPEMVMLVERGDLDSPEARRIVSEYLLPLKEKGIDQLVLGCTHFPFLDAVMKAVLGDSVTLVDPAPAVARQTARIWNERAEKSEKSEAVPPEVYYTSGDPVRFAEQITQLIGVEKPDVRAVVWQDYVLVL